MVLHAAWRHCNPWQPITDFLMRCGQCPACRYPKGMSATATFSFQLAANAATVFGDAGRIEVPDAHAPTETTIFTVKYASHGTLLPLLSEYPNSPM